MFFAGEALYAGLDIGLDHAGVNQSYASASQAREAGGKRGVMRASIPAAPFGATAAGACG
jgi:hypothetical protein